MKRVQAICLVWLTCGAVVSARSQQFRTDINPALLYYQAFLLTPDLNEHDRNFFWGTNSWLGQHLPEELGRLLGQYDAQFALVRRAARCTAPCDWGIDLAAGPATMLPQLARAKAVAQAARLRVMWDLQQGKPEEARDDWLAAFSLARNISGDGTLISYLVQIASEAIEYTALAENFGKFSPEVLQQILNGIDAAPAGSSVASAISREKVVFLDWTLQKVKALKKENPGDDAKVMEGIQRLLTNTEDPGNTNLWAEFSQAAGGTSDGFIKLLNAREETYQQLVPFFAAPYAEYKEKLPKLTAELESSPNPFLRLGPPAFFKSRMREFRIQVTRAMVRAAVEYRLHGEAGLEKVTDPCGQGPFGFERLVFEGKDRGFLLRSVYEDNGKQEVFIFVETEGTPFRVNGPHAGEGYSTESNSAMDAFRRRYGLSPTSK